MSLRELLAPAKWASSLHELDVSIAAVLDVWIKSAPVVERSLPSHDCMEVDPDEPTPWLDCPRPDLQAPVVGASLSCCQVALPGQDRLVSFRLGSHCRLRDFVSAHAKLHESIDDCSFALHDGSPIDMDHVLEVGQTILVSRPLTRTCHEMTGALICDVREYGPLPEMPAEDESDL